MPSKTRRSVIKHTKLVKNVVKIFAIPRKQKRSRNEIHFKMSTNHHLPASLTIQTIRVQPGLTSISSPTIKTPDLSGAWCPFLTTIGGQLSPDGELSQQPQQVQYHVMGSRLQQVTAGQQENNHNLSQAKSHRKTQRRLNYSQDYTLTHPLPSIRITPSFKYIVIPNESLAHIFHILSKTPFDLERFIIHYVTTSHWYDANKCITAVSESNSDSSTPNRDLMSLQQTQRKFFELS